MEDHLVHAISGPVAGLWGLLGGLSVVLLEFWTSVRRYQRLPWQRRGRLRRGRETGPLIYVLAESFRCAVGGLVAWACTPEQVSGVFGAFGVGIAAPKILETIANSARLPKTPPGPVVDLDAAEHNRSPQDR